MNTSELIKKIKNTKPVENLKEILGEELGSLIYLLIDEVEKNERKDNVGVIKAIPYQLCPKCNGQGTMSKPPYIPGDVNQWSSSSCQFQCDVCQGQKIIPMSQPQQDNAGSDAIAFAKWIHGNYAPIHSLKWIKRNIGGKEFYAADLYKMFLESQPKQESK